MKKSLLLLLILVVVSCGESKTKSVANTEISNEKGSHHSQAIIKVFNAHGGYEQWASLKTMAYDFAGSHTIVDLQNRYTLIEGEEQQVGFDGANVWVNPPSENAERQRMRYNLMWYFYAFPFVVGDPGVIYETLDPIVLGEETYNAVKISYEDGVGDSPKDNYIILSDQSTDQMKWLMYTATFGASEAKSKYSLIKYEGWQERGGVVLPTTLQWYNYKDAELGEPSGKARVFENVSATQEVTNKAKFDAPESAYILEN